MLASCSVSDSDLDDLKLMQGGALYNQVMRLLRNLVSHGFYKVHDKVLNTNDYGVTHNRPRLYIIGIRKDKLLTPFAFPPKQPRVPLESILDPYAPPVDDPAEAAQLLADSLRSDTARSRPQARRY